METKRRWRTADKSHSRQLTYEDFQPSFDWTQDSNFHVLLVDLPDFKKEEVRVQVDSSENVTVDGERRMSENKHIRFKQVFSVPEDSDSNKISAKFDSGILFVIVPKKSMERKEEPKKVDDSARKIEEEKEHEKSNNQENPRKGYGDNNKHEHGHDHLLDGRKGGLHGDKERERGEKEDSSTKKKKENLGVLMENVLDKISKNKAVVVTAVFAFSVGWYLSHKLQSSGECP